MAKYTVVKRYGSEFLRRNADGAFIPKDKQNRDYAEYLEWVAAGNTPSVEE